MRLLNIYVGTIYLFSLLFLFGNYTAAGQSQLDVQGQVDSEDTVMVVRVNSNAMFRDVVGLDVFSHPAPGRGIGGSFYGGNIGVKAEGRETALYGKSQNTYGVYAISENGVAGYFKGADGKMDIVLGGSAWDAGTDGDNGVIGISAAKPSGDLYLISNDATVIQLDENDDENGHLIIRNGDNEDVLNINESGFLSFADGTLQTSAPFKSRYSKVLLGTSNAFTLGVLNLWQALGDGATFTKQRGDTNLELSAFVFAYADVSSSSFVTYALRVNGAETDIVITDRINTIGNGNIYLNGVLTGLPAGTHTVQIFAKPSTVPISSVRIDMDSPVLIKEVY